MDRTIVIAPRSWDTVCWNRTPRIVAICTRTGPYNSIWLDLKHVAETHVTMWACCSTKTNPLVVHQT